MSGLENDRLGRHVLVVEVQLLRADSYMWCGRVVLFWWLRRWCSVLLRIDLTSMAVVRSGLSWVVVADGSCEIMSPYSIRTIVLLIKQELTP